jgi:NADPH:quinone reductase-like Zn-dependent oxidoreductase
MKALVLTQPKHIEITTKPIPEAGAGEVIVKLKAAALNHRDQWIREGKYPGIEAGVTLGSDGAGTVYKIGVGVNGVQEGQEVIINPNINWGEGEVQGRDYTILGMPVDGTLAEYVKVKANRLAPKPEHLSWAEAAALPLGGLTAYRAVVTQGKVEAGQRVLINGIGGGVAQWAFKLAKAAGAKVWVTSSQSEKIAEAQRQGANGGFNYREDHWAKNAGKESGGFHLIIDSAGGDGLNSLLDAVCPGGTIVFYGATTGVPKNLNLHKIFWQQIRLQGSTMGSDQEFQDMVAMVNQHHIKPIIEEPIPFENIIDAFNLMKEGRQFGKLVVTFD